MLERFTERLRKQRNSPTTDEIFFRYADTMSMYSGSLEDIRVLSHSKNEIKVALISKYRAIEASTAKEAIKTAYMSLASFQPMSLSDLSAVKGFNEGMGIMRSGRVGSVTDVKRSAELIASHGDAYQELSARAANESLLLRSELQQMGMLDADS